MIFVNTDLETAVSRDAKRDRTLGAKNITPMWQAVQKNIGRFQNLFRQNMFIVDNSDGSDYENAILGTYRKVGAWSRSPVRNRFALAWIKDQKQRRNITRESVDEACWVGWKQKGMKKKGNRIVPNCVKEDDLEEKIKDMEMGDVIKDFYKSDAPQFKGKSKKKRREMAIAAKLQSQEEDVQEDLRKWFGKGPKGDWVRVGTDGEIKGKCARGSLAKVNPSVCPVQRLTVCPKMTEQLLPDANAEKTPLQIGQARVVNPSW